jgi:predicted RNA-binding protein associated with RNAse of E/G family
MNVRSAERPDWERVVARRFLARRIDSREYHGYVTLLCIDQVSEPLLVDFAGQSVCIVDRGYRWVQHFPDNARYTLLAAFDERGELVQWYIDLVGRTGVDERGVPWYEDLYLDIVISPQGAVLLLDVVELDEALRQGEVTAGQYDAVWRQASVLLDALEADVFPLLWLSDTHRRLLEERMEAG